MQCTQFAGLRCRVNALMLQTAEGVLETLVLLQFWCRGDTRAACQTAAHREEQHTPGVAALGGQTSLGELPQQQPQQCQREVLWPGQVLTALSPHVYLATSSWTCGSVCVAIRQSRLQSLPAACRPPNSCRRVMSEQASSAPIDKRRKIMS